MQKPKKPKCNMNREFISIYYEDIHYYVDEKHSPSLQEIISNADDHGVPYHKVFFHLEEDYDEQHSLVASFEEPDELYKLRIDAHNKALEQYEVELAVWEDLEENRQEAKNQKLKDKLIKERKKLLETVTEVDKALEELLK